MVSFLLNPATQLVTTDDPSPTTSVHWDRVTQEAIINTSVGPTVTTRALALVHTAMYDAWSAYDEVAISTQQGNTLQRPTSENTDANKSQAMSIAAYRVLVELFPDQTSIFNALMAELGYDTTDTSTDITTPVGIGNVSAEVLMAVRRTDGSNQLGTDPNGTLGVVYSDNSGYSPVNPVGVSIDITRWTPERVPIDAVPGTERREQRFLTPHWGSVEPFSLTSGSQFRPVAPEPFLLVDGTVDLATSTITLADNSVVTISPSLVGTIINPAFIEQAEMVVSTSANLTDEQKLIAEFWEDGGGTSFPPGTWMTFGQFVSARDYHSLDQDAQLFFMLANAEFDASIATWDAKAFYDYTRPVRAIRKLGELGLIGEFNASLGGFAIDAWTGAELGTQTILATDFLTYQTPGSDPSPPFAEYVSGHSTFSAAGATILELFSGSDTFGGSVSFNTGESRFEPGVTPQVPLTLEWDRFSDASNEGGISRIYGGIHFEDGDFNGRTLGQDVAASVFAQALFYINGGVEQNVVVGTREADGLVGTDDRDQLYGRSGKDRLQGGASGDLLYGGDGNDTLWGDRRSGEKGRDTLWGGNGGDRLFGGRGSDTLMGDAGRDRIQGNQGNDTLFGGDDSDKLFGNQGKDQLRGERGNDQLRGGDGDDQLVGGAGRDRLLGNRGNDVLQGGNGKDTLEGGIGNDILVGGGGKDTFVIANLPGFDVIKGFANDQIQLKGSLRLEDLTLSQNQRGDTLIATENTVLVRVNGVTLSESDFV